MRIIRSVPSSGYPCRDSAFGQTNRNTNRRGLFCLKGKSGMPWNRVTNFSDPLSLQAALQSATQAEILPTARGPFQVEATQIDTDRLRMQRFQVDLPQIVTVATAPDRKIIGFLIEGSSSDLHHSGLKVAPGDILVYGNEVLHQRSGYGFLYGTNVSSGAGVSGRLQSNYWT